MSARTTLAAALGLAASFGLVRITHTPDRFGGIGASFRL